jgi:hypothetical protein
MTTPSIIVPERAISIKQPWAWAIMQPGGKDIENRSWKLPERYIGQMLGLHTGKRPDPVDAWYAVRNAAGKFPPQDHGELHLGCIVGVIRFSKNITSSPSVWFSGPNGWVIDGAVALPTPIPCRGALGFFKPDHKAQSLAVEEIKEFPCLENERGPAHRFVSPHT